MTATCQPRNIALGGEMTAMGNVLANSAPKATGHDWMENSNHSWENQTWGLLQLQTFLPTKKKWGIGCRDVFILRTRLQPFQTSTRIHRIAPRIDRPVPWCNPNISFELLFPPQQPTTSTTPSPQQACPLFINPQPLCVHEAHTCRTWPTTCFPGTENYYDSARNTRQERRKNFFSKFLLWGRNFKHRIRWWKKVLFFIDPPFTKGPFASTPSAPSVFPHGQLGWPRKQLETCFSK